MKTLLSIMLTASLLLSPFATFATGYGSPTKQVPPVAQPLVREGDFAVKLAATLSLGLPENEDEAEDLLAKVGVTPLNGWISDYPVTPQIVGQLDDSIHTAAAEGKLPMKKDEAIRGLYSLTSQMTLPTPAGEGSAAPEGNKVPEEPSSPQMISNYYYDQGPPLITYYPPPAYYGYLYDWVPYPVFWFGFWFPGYFVCHSFTRVVVVNTRPVIVSNNVIDRHGRKVAVVDPIVRTNSGSIRPITTLRTESGRTFRNLGDLRNGVSLTGRDTGMPRNSSTSALRTEGFRSPEARMNAEAIYSRSVERMQQDTVREGDMARGAEGRYIEPGAPDRTFNGPLRGGGERRFAASGSPGRSFRSPMIRGSYQSARRFTAPTSPSMGGAGRRLGAPSSPSRPVHTSVVRGGSSSMRSFSGNGWHSR